LPIQEIKRQIAIIENELLNDKTMYNKTFLKNRKIDLEQLLKRKQDFILSGV